MIHLAPYRRLRRTGGLPLIRHQIALSRRSKALAWLRDTHLQLSLYDLYPLRKEPPCPTS